MNLSYSWLASAALAAFGTAHTAEAAPPTKFKIDHTAKCKYLHTNCKGSETTLSATFIDQRGETVYGLTQFRERDRYVVFDERLKLRDIGYIRGVSQWYAEGSGLRIFAQRKIKLTENAVISAGVYLGKIQGDIHLRSRVDVHTDPFTIKFYGRTYDVKGYDRNLWSHHKGAGGDTYYSGVTLDSGFAYKATSRMTLIAGQSATAGLDLAEASLNAGMIVSTHSEHSTRTPMGTVCEGRPAYPRHGMNFMFNACVSKRYHDALLKAEKKKADELGDRITGRLHDLADLVRYRGSVPSYNGDRVLKEFGVTPYDLRAHIQLSTAHESGFSGGVQIPVGKDRHRWDPTFYGSFEYSFK